MEGDGVLRVVVGVVEEERGYYIGTLVMVLGLVYLRHDAQITQNLDGRP